MVGGDQLDSLRLPLPVGPAHSFRQDDGIVTVARRQDRLEATAQRLDDRLGQLLGGVVEASRVLDRSHARHQ